MPFGLIPRPGKASLFHLFKGQRGLRLSLPIITIGPFCCKDAEAGAEGIIELEMATSNPTAGLVPAVRGGVRHTVTLRRE